jgi:hypothetical protein
MTVAWLGASMAHEASGRICRYGPEEHAAGKVEGVAVRLDRGSSELPVRCMAVLVRWPKSPGDPEGLLERLSLAGIELVHVGLDSLKVGRVQDRHQLSAVLAERVSTSFLAQVATPA